MSAAKIKGLLLEYIVARLLKNCGFTPVMPDGLIVYRHAGLTMINGKGAAHDADVLLNPPIQMPFSYPYRIIFECKAYAGKTKLPVVRNAFGLRYDINEFEVVTRTQLGNRRNNVRSEYAIDKRQRFNYQVGIASVEEFTKPAFEFAANNKIPLLSLRWFLPEHTCNLFKQITEENLSEFSRMQIRNLSNELRDGSAPIDNEILNSRDNVLGEIFAGFREFERSVVIGLLESGDMLFLISRNDDIFERVSNMEFSNRARFHYRERGGDYWELSLEENQNISFGFRLPRSIVSMWKEQNFSRQSAIDLKSTMFSKVFVFTGSGEIPFKVMNIDRHWLEEIEIALG